MAGRAKLKHQDDHARRRRELIRRASYYSIGFLVAGVAVALVGAALVALLLGFAGMPFLPTWLGTAGLVVVVALIGSQVKARKN